MKYAKSGKPTMRSAINEMCKQCIYDPTWKGGGNWRQQVQACPSTGCPLYELRPVSKPETQAEKESRARRKSKCVG